MSWTFIGFPEANFPLFQPTHWVLSSKPRDTIINFMKQSPASVCKVIQLATHKLSRCFIAAVFARVDPLFYHEPNKSIVTNAHFISFRQISTLLFIPWSSNSFSSHRVYRAEFCVNFWTLVCVLYFSPISFSLFLDHNSHIFSKYDFGRYEFLFLMLSELTVQTLQCRVPNIQLPP